MTTAGCRTPGSFPTIGSRARPPEVRAGPIAYEPNRIDEALVQVLRARPRQRGCGGSPRASENARAGSGDGTSGIPRNPPQQGGGSVHAGQGCRPSAQVLWSGDRRLPARRPPGAGARCCPEADPSLSRTPCAHIAPLPGWTSDWATWRTHVRTWEAMWRRRAEPVASPRRSRRSVRCRARFRTPGFSRLPRPPWRIWVTALRRPRFGVVFPSGRPSRPPRR